MQETEKSPNYDVPRKANLKQKPNLTEGSELIRKNTNNCE